MKLEQQHFTLTKEKKTRVSLIGMSSILLILTAIQSFVIVALLRYTHGKHETHFIPSQFTQKFSLSNTRVSESYLRDMTNFLSQLRFNVTASSATDQFNVLLGHVDSTLYGEIRAQLVKEIEQINQEHLSSAFYPLSWEFDMKHLQVKVGGQMKRYAGADLISDGRETFLIQYSYNDGLLKMTHIENAY